MFFLIENKYLSFTYLKLYASEAKTSNEIVSNVKMSEPIFEAKITHALKIINVYIIEYWSFSYENTECSWLHRL